MYRNRIIEIFQHTKKTATKSEKVVNLVDKKKNYKDHNKSHKRKLDSYNKKNTTTKNDSVTEIQVSDLDTSPEIEDNDPMGW